MYDIDAIKKEIIQLEELSQNGKLKDKKILKNMEKIKIIGQIINIIEQDIVYLQETARAPKIIDPSTPRLEGEGGSASRRRDTSPGYNKQMTGRSMLSTQNLYNNMGPEQK